MNGPDDALDYIRILLALMNIYTLCVLFCRFNKAETSEWNVKTRDLWYALMMWTAGGTVFCLQAIILDRPFTLATVFIVAATLVGGKGVHAKGPWGGTSA